MGTYAEYNGKVYPVTIRNEKCRLKSMENESGFMELIDLGGNLHQDLFVKEVTFDEIDSLFELKYKIIYKGKEYEPFSIGKLVINQGKIMLFSNDVKDLEDNAFEKQEQFVFKKEVAIDEIDSLIEIKEPMLDFSSLPKERKVIPNDEIEAYWEDLKCPLVI
ncbi:MAG: hypothetical protein ACI33P_13185 [Lysinibacillus sp.]